jgi:hypothetical protein
MSITAQSVVRRAFEVLQDTTSVRWPLHELVRWLNDGQREVAMYRPDSMSTNFTMTCATGSKQSIPATGTKLINVVRNANSANKRAMRMVEREVLDSQTPGWHNLSTVTEAVHYMFDPRDPKVFYVYPPVANTVQLDIVYSALPTAIAEPADGAAYTTITGDLTVPDIFANAVLDYILYRAYSKDSEYAGNMARAQSHYTAFANSMGIEVKGLLAASPNIPNATFNPNMPRAKASA